MDYEEIRKLKAKFEEVPGTYLFNADRCRQGYWLNTFCSSMSKEENRKAFLADETAYLDSRFPQLTAEQRRCGSGKTAKAVGGGCRRTQHPAQAGC